MLAGLMLGASAAFIIERESQRRRSTRLARRPCPSSHPRRCLLDAVTRMAPGYVLLAAICLSVALSEQEAGKAGVKVASREPALRAGGAALQEAKHGRSAGTMPNRQCGSDGTRNRGIVAARNNAGGDSRDPL